MATRLDSDISRETDVMIDGKRMIITLSVSDGITLRLKGQTGHGRKVGIHELWGLLGNDSKGSTIRRSYDSDDRYPQPSEKDVKRVLNDIRSHSIISDMTYQDKVRFEAIIKSMMDVYGY